jgi:hypothetical protein
MNDNLALYPTQAAMFHLFSKDNKRWSKAFAARFRFDIEL